MRPWALVVRLVLAWSAAASAVASAQEPAAPDTAPKTPLPREVAVEAAARFNASNALRVVGRLDVTGEQDIKGDVAVLDGPVTVAGHIGGRLTVINSDLTLVPGATVDSGILVVGGALHAPADTTVRVGASTLVFEQRLHYHRDHETLVLEGEGEALTRWWTRWLSRRRARNYTDISISSAHTYNRVEGLPIYIGPAIRRELPWDGGSLSIEALGIVRTQNFKWDDETFGYRVGAEVGAGRDPRVRIGLHAYSEVAPVENWQLGDAEVGLASFFFRRDYRDYYERHGASAVVTLANGSRTNLTLSLANEHWGTRTERNPFALTPTDDDWRPNPELDPATFRVANLVARVDTRNSATDIWSGWYVTADLEYGNGRIERFGPRSTSPLTAPVGPEDVDYTRLFVDVRRYNRLAPNAQLNVRGVVAGRVAGDPLPLERRLSVGGPGTLPGFDFRSAGEGEADVASCSAPAAPAGRPAECERIILAQAEYRTTFHFSFHAFGHRVENDGAWVLFSDAGRGWIVGPRAGTLQYPSDALPPFGSFMTDVGVGATIDPVGLYVAKALSRPEERPHFVIRVRRTF